MNLNYINTISYVIFQRYKIIINSNQKTAQNKQITINTTNKPMKRLQKSVNKKIIKRKPDHMTPTSS